MKITIQYNTGPEEIEIPASWEEITWQEYVDYLLSEQDPATYYVGQPHPDVFPLLSFMRTAPQTPPKHPPIIISNAGWGELEAVKQELHPNKPVILAGPTAVKAYHDINILDKPVTEYYAEATQLTNDVLQFLEQFKELGEYKVTEEERKASVDWETDKPLFEAFGFFVTLDALADGNPLKYDEILKLPAITIYNKLLLDMRKRKFSEQYHELLKYKK